MANSTNISMDLEKNKVRNQLMQNSLISKARKRRATKEAETNGQQSTSNSPKNDQTNSKDDEVYVIYHKKENVKKDDDILFIGENKIDKNDKDEVLREMAKQSLIREANRSAQRAQAYGPQGWLKPRVLTTNKRFLARTLQSVKLDHKEHEQRRKVIKEKWIRSKE